MNKTLTINLGGINFYIEENAYAQLDHYLKAVAASLDAESREETMQDIEARIAELFLESVKDRNKVVEQKLVDDIIHIMGQPEDYQVDNDGEPDDAQDAATTTGKQKGAKKLYRDIDNRVIAGVCSGLGHYFGINKVWFRLIFLVLLMPFFTSVDLVPTGSTVFFIYLILWVAVPAARTTSEKLEMQGDKIDIGNIEKKVKEEYQNLKSKVKDDSFETFLEKTGNILLAILKGLAILVGALIVLVAGVSIIAIFISFFSLGAFSISGLDSLLGVTHIYPQLPNWLTYLLIFIISAVPLLFLLFAGLKIISPRSKVIGLTGGLVLAGLWILALIPLTIYPAADFSESWTRIAPVHSEHTSQLNLDITDTLTVTTAKSGARDTASADFNKISDEITLQVLPSKKEDNTIRVQRILKAHMENPEIKAKEIDYHFEFVNDSLILNNYSSIVRNTKNITDQTVRISLYLKENTPFKITDELRPYLKKIPRSYLGHTLIFQDNQLECLDCEASSTSDRVIPADSVSTEDDSEWYQEKN